MKPRKAMVRPATSVPAGAAALVAVDFQPAVKPGLRPGAPGVTLPAVRDALRLPGGRMPPSTATRMVAATVAVGFQPAVKPGLRPGGPGVAVLAAWDALRLPGGKMPPSTATRMVAATGRDGCRPNGCRNRPANPHLIP